MRKPNLFIVGAPKAGTTSLYHYLGEHPQIYMSRLKETNFFSHKEIKDQKLYYKAEVIESEASYHALFTEASEEKIIGEASVSYLFYPKVAERLHRFNPDAKIVIVLRDPVARAFSHYLMDLRLGLVSLPFEDIVFRKSDHKYFELYHQQFVELSLYYEQVKRYVDRFGKQLKLFFFEELQKDSDSVVRALYQFLGVNENFTSSVEKTHNAFEMPKGKLVGSLYSSKVIRQLSKKVLPNQLIEKVKTNLFVRDKKPTLTVSAKNELTNFYKPDIQQLEQLIQKDLSHWYEA